MSMETASIVASAVVGGLTVAQIGQVLDAGSKIGSLSATAMMGVALIVCLWIIKIGAMKLFTLIEDMAALLQEVRDSIGKCKGPEK